MDKLLKLFRFKSALKKRRVNLGSNFGYIQMRRQLVKMSNMNQDVISVRAGRA
jgi:hypothetical protein